MRFLGHHGIMGGMTRSYELMLIVRPEVEVSEKKAEDMVKKIVEKVGGKLASVTVWVQDIDRDRGYTTTAERKKARESGLSN